ncbi:protein required for actin cytoskeleton organization and cell cycle progression [Punctularia strigosozonata HHB-11173 SS5]|uniref:protein required for actin cytoskeleton organization and cell cycle progression n=1 Tax=Punctularia strigosozonata (strain HHB-11173) TaxID=741275 RepID=UPI0004418154|nr:protein required for actin cytoskeleton organization and cell cycle progression [Punctularia strigosozonata HHB-11173 SS5]EIN07629.1 protein required for actin cytoskeleton organization and cell cycle progression [Punctularia strigosozonata HHB-11173 SS5]
MARGVLLTSNLPQLQNLIKRDPVAYREEFLQQWNHYNSIRQIFHINPDEHAQHFRELVAFISQVSPCYPKETTEFPSQLSTLLLENYGTLSPDTRKSLVQNLVMLRNKNVITSVELLKTLFPLLPRTTSSSLRQTIRKTIMSDIRSANMRTKNHKLNRAVQAMLFGMVERGMDAEVETEKGKGRANTANKGGEAAWAVLVAKELWKKGVWTDPKTVSIISLGCFHPATKVQRASIHFFLGDDEDEEEDDSDDEGPDVKSLLHKREVKKKTRSGDKKLQKSMKEAKKKRKMKSDASSPNFPAIQLLNDPQTFAEKLYELLARHDKHYSLEQKILIMQLLSRVAGAHKLCVLPFYTYIIKYLTYHQLRVPSILVALAQSVHDLTPPDALTPVIRKVAQEFVHPGVGSEVIRAGLNSIREVCRRQPWAMEEDMLGDLVEYRKSRDKGVTAAARGLLQLYREVNPGMLKKRERGKEATMGIASGTKPLPFGHSAQAAVDIDGLSLLEDHLQKLREENGDEMDVDVDDSAAWEGWDVETDSSEESSDEEGWLNVESDEEPLEVSDSEDEDMEKAKTVSSADAKQDDKLVEDATLRVSTLATTKILTPADFTLLNELKLQAATKAVEATGSSSAKRKLATLEAQKKNMASGNMAETFLAEDDILGPSKKSKADYAERMASIEKGREGREKYGSLKGKKEKANPSSSTNKQKARNKPIMMILSSGAVRGKKKASLREKQQKLRRHINKAKKAHH